MRKLHRIPLLLVAAWPLVSLQAGSTGQDPEGAQEPGQDSPVGDASPFASFADREALRLEEGLQGSWMLLEYRSGASVVKQENVRGFMMFSDGYVSITLHGRQRRRGFLGSTAEFFVQSGVHRYRIDEFGQLQTASLMACTADSADGNIAFDSDSFAREHKLSLKDDLLTLYRADGGWMSYSRMNRTEFPRSAIEALDGTRSKPQIDRDF